jgi:nitrous oxidase accessory protein NosD
VTRKSAILAVLFVLVTSLGALTARATQPPCYRVKISFRGTVLIDQVIGLTCSKPASVDSSGTTLYVRG